MPGEHLAHCLSYRKHSVNGRKCYYYDIIRLLSSGSVCQAPNYKSFLTEGRICLQATLRANNSWSRRVSRDEVRGDLRKEMLATMGSLPFTVSAKN